MDDDNDVAAVGGSRRIALAWLVAAIGVTLVSGYAPAAGRFSWALEVVPGWIAIAVLIATHRRFPFSPTSYAMVVLHLCVLAYGGYYTYAKAPLGFWAAAQFGWRRNHYDRVGHFALGFFPTFVVRDLFRRATPLGNKIAGRSERSSRWLEFFTVVTLFAVGAFWELIEWWTTLLVADDVGVAFLGSQGDIWDAQWDMLWILIGTLSATLMLRGYEAVRRADSD